MRGRLDVGFITVMCLLSGCAPGAVPTAPGTTGRPFSLTETTALLMFSKISAAGVRNAGQVESFVYSVTFQLREISGKSGARITRIETVGHTGLTELMTSDCLGDSVRVAPGGTLDAPWDASGGCYPSFESGVQVSRIEVAVGYLDDDGRYGVIRATAEPPR